MDNHCCTPRALVTIIPQLLYKNLTGQNLLYYIFFVLGAVWLLHRTFVTWDTINTDLAYLLSGITEANLHNECDTGEAVGNENW